MKLFEIPDYLNKKMSAIIEDVDEISCISPNSGKISIIEDEIPF